MLQMAWTLGLFKDYLKLIYNFPLSLENTFGTIYHIPIKLSPVGLLTAAYVLTILWTRTCSL